MWAFCNAINACMVDCSHRGPRKHIVLLCIYLYYVDISFIMYMNYANVESIVKNTYEQSFYFMKLLILRTYVNCCHFYQSRLCPESRQIWAFAELFYCMYHTFYGCDMLVLKCDYILPLKLEIYIYNEFIFTVYTF